MLQIKKITEEGIPLNPRTVKKQISNLIIALAYAQHRLIDR